ncbi:4a-hydroxytetrahydrobiopterin dehydratase [Paracoccus sp. M683]|uniref:4a-hydroxytetrahydrobiopterin dehydratase n=1 Tax=Paracoccus sp. M683 TaxID=2594268 RepID=UPI00117E385E|nr:4a-hydroxytetrahydrobiopterin dehydratase [Paracoccus sp. M683]TRW99233.1 4a-hydroxytetrahydrobiopterin dehydratase [Paracoccus sp. M683]
MSSSDLFSNECEPCKGGVAPLAAEAVGVLMAQLEDWVLSDDGTTIRRRFAFKGFLKSVEMANLAAWLGNKQGHHPDISFGWGYCEVAFTTHEAGGLTRNDFICAAKLDTLVA